MKQKPTIGRIVHATIKDLRGEVIVRPAIITRTWGDDTTCVQATIFPDASNDDLGFVVSRSSLAYDEAGQQENSWRWPVSVSSPAQTTNNASVVISVSSLFNILEAQRELCHAIEKLPASGEATNLTLAASDIAFRLQNILTGKQN